MQADPNCPRCKGSGVFAPASRSIGRGLVCPCAHERTVAIRQNFAKRFIAARERLDLSDWSAAIRLGVMVERLRRIEDASETPDSAMLEKAIEHYDIGLHYFFEQDDSHALRMLNLEMVPKSTRKIVVAIRGIWREGRSREDIQVALVDLVSKLDDMVAS